MDLSNGDYNIYYIPSVRNNVHSKYDQRCCCNIVRSLMLLYKYFYHVIINYFLSLLSLFLLLLLYPYLIFPNLLS